MYFSGLLVTWLTLKDLNKRKGVGYWITFYVHRFWRSVYRPMYHIHIHSKLLA